MTAWHQQSPADVLKRLESDEVSGLFDKQIQTHRQIHGLNELVATGGRSPWRIVGEQFRSAMVLLLVSAAVVSMYLGELIDAGAIVSIIVLNAALGFFQDYRAERALAALRRMATPVVKARRDGEIREVAAKELVPGDVVLLEVGNFIPADCRLLECVNLRIDEASLTGESEPVDKSVDAIGATDLPLGDRKNMAYKGTLATYGHGLAVVTETGMSTELGRIAHSLQTVEAEPTPLQRRLAQLGRTLAIVSLVIVAMVFTLGIAAGEKPDLMLMTALSLAVAIVPEGLPAVATVALAIGARRMFRRQVLIRKLPAVETLGSVTVICSDKTGTLTENRMTVTVLETADRHVEIAAATADQSSIQEVGFSLLLGGAALCNDAELLAGGSPDSPRVLGEPTEAALVAVAAKSGISRTLWAEHFPRVREVPFDSRRKRMTTVHALSPDQNLSDEDKRAIALREQLGRPEHVVFMKGAVDSVLRHCQYVFESGRSQVLDERRRSRVEEAHDKLAASGMRVLGVAFRTLDDFSSMSDDDLEHDLVFAGMFAIIDPPRPEVKDAVTRCRAAGIRPIMITGDHPLTAEHIAEELGIVHDGTPLTGQELASMSPDDLESHTKTTSVFARVAPTDKLHIVQALQNQRQVVAMTGDGVNDAPALKKAHIGVAMGQIGTDVSKEASEMVLLDDNFATIVNAVEEGRIVYDNIRKFVKYTMTSNAGEIWVMVLGPLLGMPLPLLPLQILWINLVTDGLPGLALAVEPAESDTMRRPPYPPGEHIMGRGMWRDIAWIGLLMGAVSLALGYWQWREAPASNDHWRTIVFTVLTLSQMGNAMAIRSSRDSLFKIGVLSNKVMLGSVLLTFLLQIAVVYLPPLQTVFKTTALSAGELVACLLLSTVVFWAAEAKKWLSGRSASRTPAD